MQWRKTLFMERFLIKKLREEVARSVRAGSWKSCGERFGVDPGVLRGFVRGGDMLTLNADKIAAALGMPLYFGPPQELGPVETTVVDGEDYSGIPYYDVKVSAGPGAEAEDERVKGRIAFRTSWLRERGIEPTESCLVDVKGDSMEPRLKHGDLVLIDRREHELRARSVYAFVDVDGALRVKRLERVGQLLVLTSDNPEFPTETRPPELVNQMVVVGRVVWSAHNWT